MCIRKYLLLVLIVFLSVGCASKSVQMKHNDLSALRNEHRVIFLHRETPSFYVMTAGKAVLGGVFGLIGGGIAAAKAGSDGKKLIEETGIADPTIGIKRAFVEELQRNQIVIQPYTWDKPIKEVSNNTYKKHYKTGMVFEFETKNWNVSYYPTDWKHYRTSHVMHVRLIRVKDAKVIWKNTCKYVEDQPKGSRPTLDQVKENRGAILKARFAEAREMCVQRLLQAFTAKEGLARK